MVNFYKLKNVTYYLDIFSPETYEAFTNSPRNVSGFRITQKKLAQKIKPGDRFICYMTKLSRWIGILEVVDGPFVKDDPLFYLADDPFVVRFHVKPHVWLEKEKAIPIHEDEVWKTLSFTQKHDKTSSKWTGKFRGSLSVIEEADGKFLENLLLKQMSQKREFRVSEGEYEKYFLNKVKRENREVNVFVPTEQEEKPSEVVEVRQSIKVQSLLARIGEIMGFNIWLPRADRQKISKEWNPEEASVLLDHLPLNYDEVTLKTIEQIDVLWLKKRSIVRAFEVEHTTSIYSGILRMADLLALQPNMDIKLHIVAPEERRDKVFQEIQRPVFSLLERAPLAEVCTLLTYESVDDIASAEHLQHLADSVLGEYEEYAE